MDPAPLSPQGGLYTMARRSALRHFPGIDSHDEALEASALHFDATSASAQELAEQVTG